ncbi:MAG: hypothetical protein LBE31_08905 [Deltaproteobacteria bacterium]|jgi:tetratricopeptide (TPR) repeat protein|nr:hypothetical protein [Deltaproteobacteria bacterium]
MRENLKTKIAVFLFSVLAFLVFMGILTERRARSELELARAAVALGQFDSADRHYFQALNWYAPLGSSQKAAEELLALANNHLKEGRKPLALLSLLRLRSALIAARSFYLPRKDLLEKINPVIAQLLAENKLGHQANEQVLDGQALDAQAKAYLRLYTDLPPMDQKWPFLAVAGFLVWIGGAFEVIKIYFRSQVKFNSLVLPLVVFICGYCLWLISLTKA